MKYVKTNKIYRERWCRSRNINERWTKELDRSEKKKLNSWKKKFFLKSMEFILWHVVSSFCNHRSVFCSSFVDLRILIPCRQRKYEFDAYSCFFLMFIFILTGWKNNNHCWAGFENSEDTIARLPLKKWQMG